uniref:COP9 signalosome complex subunit 5 n=1 Tax=Globodera rostochiensis TaxID=31243 RepID=A0A914I336_GLORO
MFCNIVEFLELHRMVFKCSALKSTKFFLPQSADDARQSRENSNSTQIHYQIVCPSPQKMAKQMERAVVKFKPVNAHQEQQPPFVAIVIDPIRTISAGKVAIGASRIYPKGYKPPDESPSEYQTIPLNKIEDFGVHYSVLCGLPTAKFHRLHVYENCTNSTRQPAQKDGQADAARGRQVQAGQRAPGTTEMKQLNTEVLKQQQNQMLPMKQLNTEDLKQQQNQMLPMKQLNTEDLKQQQNQMLPVPFSSRCLPTAEMKQLNTEDLKQQQNQMLPVPFSSRCLPTAEMKQLNTEDLKQQQNQM